MRRARSTDFSRVLALAVRVGPWLGVRDEGGRAPEVVVVEHDQPEVQ